MQKLKFTALYMIQFCKSIKEWHILYYYYLWWRRNGYPKPGFRIPAVHTLGNEQGFSSFLAIFNDLFNLPKTHFSIDSRYPKIGFRVPVPPLNSIYYIFPLDVYKLDRFNLHPCKKLWHEKLICIFLLTKATFPRQCRK